MVDCFVIGILTVLIIAQNIFWARVCLNLTNRIMSRSYAELKQADNSKPTLLKPLQDEDEGYDPIAERQAKELNSMLGMV